MHILTLREFKEDRFIEEINRLESAKFKGDERNASWFSHLKKVYKKKFKEWFFLMDGDKIVAFATIQEFYPNCYRLLTRTYIYPDYRRFILPENDSIKSPSLYILPEQIKYIQHYDTLCVSMQDIKRRKSLERYGQKLKSVTHLKWIMHPNMIKTCNTPKDKNCWQNMIYTGKELNLESITIDEWKQL